MAKSRHYTPQLRRFLVSKLYHAAKAHKVPMSLACVKVYTGSIERLNCELKK
jgi:hypothetical protein